MELLDVLSATIGARRAIGAVRLAEIGGRIARELRPDGRVGVVLAPIGAESPTGEQHAA